MLETIKRILAMAGKYRHKITIGIIISLLHSFFSAMDLFAILYISFSINTLTQQKIGVAAAILLVGLTGKIICKYQIKADDDALIAQVKCQVPKGSRICMIAEIEGDFELSELSRLAESVELLFVNKRMVYLDRELAKEYVGEVKRGEL